MLDEFHKKEKPFQGLAGMGGGVVSRVLGGALGPFQASGGTKSGPTGGYFYHEFTSNGTFEVTDGIADIEVMLQGAGGQGGGGAGGNGPGGGGGGGGATGVWTITGVTIATHPVTIAAGRSHPGGVNNGDSGQSTKLTLPSSGNVNSGGGGGGISGNNSPPGAGGSGGSNSDPWAAATLTGDYSGGNGQPGPASGGSNGGAGGEAGGRPQPSSLWWRPYINPGSGGSGGPPGGGNGNKGSNRGGGGGGGGGNNGPGGQKGGSTAGICVIRYPDAV
jgi:hypothetical protein